MLLSLGVRDLLLASWKADAAVVARTLPAGLEPAEVDGRTFVSIATMRFTGGRLGPLPVPPFSQLNVRAYVEHEGEPAVFFLSARVTWPGMGGALLGAPYRPARIRVASGRIEAPGLGVSLAYEVDGEAGSNQLTTHLLGLFEAAGVRAFRIRRGAAGWKRAEAVGPVRADPLVALGFDVGARPDLLYAPKAAFQAVLPPRRL